MSTALILRDDSAFTVSWTAEALALKNQAIEAAALVGVVKDAVTQAAAVDAQQQIAGILSLAEKARVACKQPWLDGCRRIDAKHKEFVADLVDEQKRIGLAVGEFQEIEAAKARAAEQARRLEQERIEREKREAELAAIRKAEAERQALEAKQRELAALAEQARSKKAQEALERQRVELERQKALAEAKSHEELDRINAQASQAQQQLSEIPIAAPVRAQGQRVKEEWEIEVWDIDLLNRAHPSCVKKTPLLTEIKGLLDAGVDVKGVRAKKITKAGVTIPRSMAAINV